MNKNKIFTLTPEQLEHHKSILELQNICTDGILDASELVQYNIMTKRKKEKLVKEIYFQNRRRKEFIKCGDGRIKSQLPQFIAQTEEALIEKLYVYYFDVTLESYYKKWVKHRYKIGKVAKTTIENDTRIWTSFFANTELAKMQITLITSKHLFRIFEAWTGCGLITRKDFNNRKTMLNGIFKMAMFDEAINFNPLTAIDLSEFRFKTPKRKKKAYTIEERKKLITYVQGLPQDAYTLAIQFAFYGIFRIGEIKALKWKPEHGHLVSIEEQLVYEREMKDDLSFHKRKIIAKDPKGNPYYSIREERVGDVGLDILEQMYKLNPKGEFLFMFNGMPLTTVSFNRRLKRYCEAIEIPYLSSHKIRFTGASMLYDAGAKPIDIQPLLGYSSLAMTQHYIGEMVRTPDNSFMAQVLL